MVEESGALGTLKSFSVLYRLSNSQSETRIAFTEPLKRPKKTRMVREALGMGSERPDFREERFEFPFDPEGDSVCKKALTIPATAVRDEREAPPRTFAFGT
jgi:hypothetical protein